MRKGCEITLCCSSTFLLYWAVNNAGVIILKILLKYLIMTLIIQELVQKNQALWQVKYAVRSLLIAHRAEQESLFIADVVVHILRLWHYNKV